jgi:hypothetical protein
MRRRLIAALFVPYAVFASAAPAWAHCTFELDRERTTPGGEFYGIGTGFVPGELVEIRWATENGPLLDRFVIDRVERNDDYGNTTYGGFRRRLTAPSDAKPEFYWVWAIVTQPGNTQHDPEHPAQYAFQRGLWVDDPAARPAVPARDAPQTPAGGVPVPAARPVVQPQEAPATQPVRVAVRVPVTAPQAQTQSQPETELQLDHEPAWDSVGARAPVPIRDRHSPATEGLAHALLAVASAQASSGTLPVALAASIAMLLFTRRKRPELA